MAIDHPKLVTIADFGAGAVTVLNSAGATTTVNATDLVRPVDWNSAHDMTQNLAGNTAGTSQVVATDIQWAGGNNITLSAVGSTVSIHGDANSYSMWPPSWNWPGFGTITVNSGATTTTAGGSATTASYHICPYPIHDNIVGNDIHLYFVNNTVAGTGTGRGAHMLGLYTLNGGTRYDSVSTWMFGYSLIQNSITAQSHSFWWGTDPTAHSFGLTNSSVSVTGTRKVDLSEGNFTIPDGNYYLVHCHTASSSSVNVVNMSALGVTIGSTLGGYMGRASNTTQQIAGGFGVFSSTSSAAVAHAGVMPATINTSALTNTGGTTQQQVPYLVIVSTGF